MSELKNGFCAEALSQTGLQCSFKGIIGFVIALEEGLEINFLGFGFALNGQSPFLNLPGID